MLREGVGRFRFPRGSGGPSLIPAFYLDLTGPTLDTRVTFTRASSATVFNSSGLLTTVTTDTPRFDYTQSSPTAKGLLLEEARTNIALYNRDLTDSAWTKTNCTAAKDQTGIDGVSNSASKLTASASNGTCLQTVTLASSQRFQTVYVKRLVGSGTVEMTSNGGTTWTAVTVTSEWTRVSIPAVTVANPSFGFRLATSGDSVAFDCVQNETGAFSTSPIITTTTAVTRAAESATVTGTGFSSWYNPSEGTFVVAGIIPPNPASFPAFMAVSDGTINNSMWLYAHTGGVYTSIRVGNVSQGDVGTNATQTAGNSFKYATGYQSNNNSGSLNGATGILDTSASIPTVNLLRIGGNSAGTAVANTHIRSIAYYPVRRTDLELRYLSAA